MKNSQRMQERGLLIGNALITSAAPTRLPGS